jgi:hypothetical protein
MSDLLRAAADGNLAAIKRLHAEGVDVTERGAYGFTAIMLAAMRGHIATVKFLHAAGASITEKNNSGFSALLYAAACGKLSILQYFLEEAGASISDVTSNVGTVWMLLELKDASPMAIAALLKVMVMLGDAPPKFVAKLSQAHAEIAARGQQYRVQLPSYLEQQRAMVVAHCPFLLCCSPSLEHTLLSHRKTCGRTGCASNPSTVPSDREWWRQELTQVWRCSSGDSSAASEARVMA